jgi:ABC-type Na+ efflux pump permease subunit
VVILLSASLGPLVEPECRRALGRGWLILVRTLAALAILAATLIDLWFWWIGRLSNPYYLPYEVFRNGLAIVVGMMVTIALVLAPAVLAGSLAGDKERGALGLLLTTRVSSREIVTARLLGKLTQVGMVLLAGLPAVILIAALAGLRPGVMAALIALPALVAFGGGGLATAVSAVSRRGRDALLTVYLLDLVFLLVPMAGSLGFSLGPFDWLPALNPYACLDSLVWDESLYDSLLTMGLWLAIGVLGVAAASWRLAPSCLSHLDGARVGRRQVRRGRVRPLDDRPMLWKELYIDKASTLGGFGRWLGAGLTLLLVGGSLAMAAVIAWDSARGSDLAWFAWAQSNLRIGTGHAGTLVSWLIEWAIGLRAAVAIASERERGTWDAILTSPLEAGEILGAKLRGCFHALRWLIAAALLAWTIALAAEAMTPMKYADLVAGTLVASAFMAAAGLRASLACPTATRAMTVTIGIWLGSLVAAWILAGLVAGISVLILLAALGSLGPGNPMAMMPWFSTFVSAVWIVARYAPYLLATIVLGGYNRLLFDRLAGRVAGGRTAVAADRFLHGRPVGPVLEPVEPA